MQDIPELIASDIRPFWKADQGLNPSCRVSLRLIILHDGNYHATLGCRTRCASTLGASARCDGCFWQPPTKGATVHFSMGDRRLRVAFGRARLSQFGQLRTVERSP